MTSLEENELRLSILRTLAGSPRTFKARDVLNSIRGEGEMVMESDFIRIFTELTQAGYVEVAEIPGVDAAQLFRITRRGIEFLKQKDGESFDAKAVEVDILRTVSRRELTKPELFESVRNGGHVIDETDFEKLFQKLEARKLVKWVSMKCADCDTRRFATTDEGKAYLAKLLTRKERGSKPDFETLRLGHIVGDMILIRLRYKSPMGKNAICRDMRPYCAEFGAREISLMVLAFEENGLLAHGKGGYKATDKASAYLEARIQRLMNSDRKRDMRDAIRLLLAELGSLQETACALESALMGKGAK